MAIILKHAWIFILELISIIYFEKDYDKYIFSILASDSGTPEDQLKNMHI